MSRVLSGIFQGLAFAFVVFSGAVAKAQPPQCDPSKVLTSESCAKCHAGEVVTWRQTAHFQTFEELHRNPRAIEIANLMGLKSIKRGNLCIDCHYTTQLEGDKLRVIEGVSCESCHGAAADWLHLHNDYGGPNATKADESPEHARQRTEASIAAGMRNPVNLYLVARSCLQCHTVPNEELVNKGTHLPGSRDFELVAWSQGEVRHNWLRTGGQENAASTQERLRVMYVVGQIADLEFSTRATAMATEKSTFGLTSAQRAAAVAMRLYEIGQAIQDPHLDEVLVAFSEARLAVNNAAQLTAIADRIQQSGIAFAAEARGENLQTVDRWLPTPDQYRYSGRTYPAGSAAPAGGSP